MVGSDYYTTDPSRMQDHEGNQAKMPRMLTFGDKRPSSIGKLLGKLLRLGKAPPPFRIGKGANGDAIALDGADVDAVSCFRRAANKCQSWTPVAKAGSTLCRHADSYAPRQIRGAMTRQ